MKKFKLLSLLILTIAAFLVAWGGDSDKAIVPYDVAACSKTNANKLASLECHSLQKSVAPASAPQVRKPVALVSREEGSGARGAFEELVGVNTDEDNIMSEDAIIQNGNGIVATFIASNNAAIGYVSFSTFLERSNALVGLYIDGAAPIIENMISGEYKLIRPFNFVYMPEDIGIIEEAFITFAGSSQGLDILEEFGVVVDRRNAVDFHIEVWNLPDETVAFGGSTSTEATAMALITEFETLFPSAYGMSRITYESVGSRAGITGAQEGTFSLGFASREIHDTELETGLNVVQYCLDGIVIVVNPANGITGLTTQQIREIYLGEITDWSEVQ